LLSSPPLLQYFIVLCYTSNTDWMKSEVNQSGSMIIGR
jgi:hypothetical protein